MLDTKAIRERVNRATSGPWFVAPEKCGPEGQGVYQESSLGCICEVGDPYPRGDNHPQENMEFIATARTDVPLLLDEVERLRAALRAIRDYASERSTCSIYLESIAEVASAVIEGVDIDV